MIVIFGRGTGLIPLEEAMISAMEVGLEKEGRGRERGVVEMDVRVREDMATATIGKASAVFAGHGAIAWANVRAKYRTHNGMHVEHFREVGSWPAT